MRDSLIGGQPINSLPCRRLISPTKMVRTAEAPGPPPFFAPPFRGKMVYAMQWAGNPNSIPASMENTHSLWAGGAAALFASGIYWIAIQRRVRWKSFTSHEYARRDSLSPPPQHWGENCEYSMDESIFGGNRPITPTCIAGRYPILPYRMLFHLYRTA